MNLPHRFPFRFVDRVADGRGVVRLTAGAFWTPGSDAWPIGWLVEAAAQSAALLLSPESGVAPENLFLAAIDEAEMLRLPGPGETVEIEIRLEARFGRLIRIRADVHANGVAIGSVGLVLSGS